LTILGLDGSKTLWVAILCKNYILVIFVDAASQTGKAVT